MEIENSIYTSPAYLKLTYHLLVTNVNKQKIVSNIRTLFEYLDTSKMFNIPNDTKVIIDMIILAIEAIDMGLKDPAAIYTYSVKDPDLSDVKDIKDMITEPMTNELQELMSEYISTIILNKPIFDKAERFAELAVAVKSAGGIKQKIQATKEFANEIEKTNQDIKEIKTSKASDEIYVDAGYDIGLDKAIKERDEENNIAIRLFGAMNKMTGGGARLRKTNLVIANTGCFKSGFLLNVALYAKENGEFPEEFLDGMSPVVLYITHENTLGQTIDRILAWYGYTKSDIDSMSASTRKRILTECLAPKRNGVRFLIKYIPPDSIDVNDIDLMIEDLHAANKKVVLCAEDYIKHVKPNMREDQIKSNAQSMDVIGVQVSALARKQFLSFWTASQFGREGQRIKDEAKEKGADYLRKLNTSYVSGGFGSTNSFENIWLLDRGKIPTTGESFLAVKQVKDRDDRNDGESDYYVMPFDKGGFKISDTKWYKSVMEMDPSLSAITDIYNTALSDIDAEIKRQEAINDAMSRLRQVGFEDMDLDMMSETDILQRAKHLAQGGLVVAPSFSQSIVA